MLHFFFFGCCRKYGALLNVCALFCAFFYSQLLALSIQMHIQHEFGKRSEITPTHDFEELRIFRKCKMKIEIFPKLDQMLYILCFEFYILYFVCCMLHVDRRKRMNDWACNWNGNEENNQNKSQRENQNKRNLHHS